MRIPALLLVLFFAPQTLQAQEPATQETKSPPQAQQPAAEPAPPAKKTSRASEERFEPSEQISEDLSVSFPSDI